jgi:exonuclease SbcD
MGYGEAGQQKEILIVESTGSDTTITPVAVPTFQKLLRLNGNLDKLLEEITQLIAEKSTAWLEIDYSGSESPSDLRARLHQAIEGSSLEIRRIKNSSLLKTLRQQTEGKEEALEDLKEIDVFNRCLDAHETPEAERPELILCYQEILDTYHTADKKAE